MTLRKGRAWAQPAVRRDRKRGNLLSRILLLPLLLLLLLPGCDRLTAFRNATDRRPAPVPIQAPAGRLQEVGPPGAVAQLGAALAGRHPHVNVISPAAETVLPPGPWTLDIQLTDWPLVRSETQGLGTHLVVQIDDEEPLRVSDWGDGDPAAGLLRLQLPPLRPGSHRLTAYAARPWGEAVKQPGASTQLLLHRVSADPLSQPTPRSPRLIPVSPAGLAQAEPVLIDWLLLDAPLQGLRQDDGQWRLRISVNGDSFLVDQNVPLWLKGFHNGSNAVLMELLDGRGEPLNPPFTSAVREVLIDSTAKRPVWLQPSLGEPALAVLLGKEPGLAPPADQEPAALPTAELDGEPDTASTIGEAPDRGTAPPSTAIPEPPASEPAPSEPAITEPSSSEPSRSEPRASEPADSGATPSEQPAPELADADPADRTVAESPEPAAQEPAAPTPAATGMEPRARQSTQSANEPSMPGQPSPEDAPASAPGPQPGTGPRTTARELVREDGSMIRQEPEGPLSALRRRLAP